jgi:peptidoglycan hydrolase-like protein with peptidoglycan-binding domain
MSRVPRDLAAPEVWEASLNRSRARRRTGPLRSATKSLNRSFSAVGRAAAPPRLLPLTSTGRATETPVRANRASVLARTRDLADGELWELSLGRSRARRRAAQLHFVPTGSRAKRLSIGTLAALSVGPASSLAQAAPAGGGRLFADMPTTTEHAITIEPGAKGAQVSKLQTALHVKADGVYGPETEDAVYQYQATHGLEVDGVVGPKTTEAIASDTPAKAPSTSNAIKIVQAALGVSVDGEYGPETYEAIKAFQESRNINVDEVVGPQTWHAMHISVDQTLSPPASAIPQPKVIPAVAESSEGQVEGAPAGAPAPSGEGAPVAHIATAADEEGNGGSEAPQEAPAAAPESAPAPEQSSGGGSSEGEGGGGGEGSGTVRRVIAAGNEIATRPYEWGGGHGSFNSSGYDCSGSVSYALHGGGLINSPEDSSELEHYGESGPGKHITIYANSEHAYMEVNGRRYDTVALAEHGSRWSNSPGSDGGSFVVRHPAGQ